MKQWESIDWFVLAAAITLVLCVFGMALDDWHESTTLQACIQAGNPPAECRKLVE